MTSAGSRNRSSGSSTPGRERNKSSFNSQNHTRHLNLILQLDRSPHHEVALNPRRSCLSRTTGVGSFKRKPPKKRKSESRLRTRKSNRHACTRSKYGRQKWLGLNRSRNSYAWSKNVCGRSKRQMPPYSPVKRGRRPWRSAAILRAMTNMAKSWTTMMMCLSPRTARSVRAGATTFDNEATSMEYSLPTA